MSDAASAYQQFVTGPEAGYEFFRNGVWFDGIRMTGEGEAVLLDAKSGADFYRKAGGLPFVQETVLEDANRQLAAAAGLRIQWHIQDRTTWEALRELFGRFQIEIELIWTPYRARARLNRHMVASTTFRPQRRKGNGVLFRFSVCSARTSGD